MAFLFFIFIFPQHGSKIDWRVYLTHIGKRERRRDSKKGGGRFQFSNVQDKSGPKNSKIKQESCS